MPDKKNDLVTVTNVSRRVIHCGDAMLVPGVPGKIERFWLDKLDERDVAEGEVDVAPEVSQDGDTDGQTRTANTGRQTPKPAAVG